MRIGDKVAVLDDDLKGVITALREGKVALTTSDGFELWYDLTEVVVLGKELRDVSGEGIRKAKEQKNDIKGAKALKSPKDNLGDISFDLHIEKLIKNIHGLQPYDILEIQIQTAQQHIEFAIKNRIPKIILIHGVGDGRLRAEIEYLIGRYDYVWYQEASYQRYGQGAIEVHFRQNASRSIK